MKYIFILITAFFLLLSSNIAKSAPEQDLEKRIVALEQQVNLLLTLLSEQKAANKLQEEAQAQAVDIEETLSLVDEEQNYALLELAEKSDYNIKIAGYADVEYKGSSEPGINEEFRMHHLSLFFTKKFSDSVRFFSEIEYEDAPTFDGVNDGSGLLEEAAGTIVVESMNFDWSFSQAANIRAGRLITPMGIWSEDHYPPYVSTQERPLHIFKIFPQVVDGISFYGSYQLANNAYFSYNVFTGNGESNISGKKDLNSSKVLGFRGNYTNNWFDEFNVGFSLYRDGKDSANNDADKMAYGFHFKTRFDQLTTQFEYAKARYKDGINLLPYDSKGMYAQFSYRMGNWDLGYRYDIFDQTTIDLDDISRNSVFVNYHFDHNITLKGEYHLDAFDNPLRDDYGFYIFSISAYLGE